MIYIKGTHVYNDLTKTTPAIVHAQGNVEDSPLWPILLKKIRKSQQTSVPLDPNLEIITYNSTFARNDGWNYPKKTLGNAEMSLDKFSVPYTVLGQNTRNWQNTLKPVLAKTFLKEISTKKYVLSMDSSDVLVIQHPNHVLDFFKTQNCKMLFNAEASPFRNMTGPVPDQWEQYEDSLSNQTFRYLNAGVWIAEREYAIEFLNNCINLDIHKMIETNQICPHAAESEQARVKCVFLNNPNVKLDYQCHVFQTILGIPDTFTKLI